MEHNTEQVEREKTIRNRRITIDVLNNGFLVTTRSGKYCYATLPALLREIADYVKVILRDYGKTPTEGEATIPTL